ncbi:MAG: hypothetical protein B6D56_00805 [Candidatus Omnitrophica bacterium 4484_70.1]|nr:MAG: hypothetical protein B6D56_00805 [Candidatus Omnitrophica bacterium 4484_70.1]
MSNLISAYNLTKIYKIGRKEFPALKKISIEVREREFLAIVGPSGAGKSTLLHILGGLLSPTEGEVFFKGENIYKKKDKWLCEWRTKHVGFVFQFYHLIEELTVLENVVLPSFLIKTSLKTAFTQAEKLLKYLKIENKLNCFPSELSGGERQKVAIARALINAPEVLFCDEPTGNLDEESAEKVFDLFDLFNKDRKTIILVTHNIELAKRAKRVLYLEGGRLKDV